MPPKPEMVENRLNLTELRGRNGVFRSWRAGRNRI
nr:MAG TPA_asm: hypothetical protein [Caudoviricetes sp.]